jgi:hypothetical protein
MTCEQVKYSELQEVVPLLLACCREAGKDTDYFIDFCDKVGHREAVLFKIEEGAPIGIVGLVFENEVAIGDFFYVVPFRRKGTATVILHRAAQRYCDEQGKELIPRCEYEVQGDGKVGGVVSKRLSNDVLQGDRRKRADVPKSL